MKYPRTAKIFRGQLEFAPLAGVLFLLVIFLLLGSLISPPGIRVQLSSSANLNATNDQPVVFVTRQGDIIFEGKTNRLEDLDALRVELKKIRPDQTVYLQAEPTTPKEVTARVRQTLELSVQLPSASNLEGTENRRLVLAINLNGQFFFQNEVVREDQLRSRLEAARGKSKEPFTLVVFADKSTTDDVVFRVGEIAQQAGIKELLLAGTPKKTAAKSSTP
jgi:biopolymer transport protein ExbD